MFLHIILFITLIFLDNFLSLYSLYMLSKATSIKATIQSTPGMVDIAVENRPATLLAIEIKYPSFSYPFINPLLIARQAKI